jgi:rhomboid protease GluP
MIGVRLDGEEIWLEPEEWEAWVQDGRIPSHALVLMSGNRWIPAGHLEPYKRLTAPQRTPARPKRRPLLGTVLFPGKDLSATEALILANLAVSFLLVITLGVDYMLKVREWTTDWWHDINEDRAVWVWIPTLFMHADAGHLLRNMVSLLAGAGAVEFLLGRRWAYVVYFITGLSGMWLSYIGHNGPPLSIGASGAVFGLVGCTVAFVARRYHMFTYRQRWKARRVYLPLFVVLFLPSLLQADYYGHVGGLLGGLVLGALIPPHQRVRDLAAEDTMAEPPAPQ